MDGGKFKFEELLFFLVNLLFVVMTNSLCCRELCHISLYRPPPTSTAECCPSTVWAKQHCHCWPDHTLSLQFLVVLSDGEEYDHTKAEFQVRESSNSKSLSNYYRLSANMHGPGGDAAPQWLLYCFSCLSWRGRGTIGANNNNAAISTAREARSGGWHSKQANPIPSHGPSLNDERIRSVSKLDTTTDFLADVSWSAHFVWMSCWHCSCGQNYWSVCFVTFNVAFVEHNCIVCACNVKCNLMSGWRKGILVAKNR